MRTIENTVAKSDKKDGIKANEVVIDNKTSNTDLLAMCEDKAKRLAAEKQLTDGKAKDAATDKGTDKACKSKKISVTPQDAYIKRLVDTMVHGHKEAMTFNAMYVRMLSYLRTSDPEAYYLVQKNKAQHTMLTKSHIPHIHVRKADKDGKMSDHYYPVRFVEYKSDKVKKLELDANENLVGFSFEYSGCKSEKVEATDINALMYTTMRTEYVGGYNESTGKFEYDSTTNAKGEPIKATKEVEHTYYPVLIDLGKTQISENKAIYTAFAKALTEIIWNTSK